MRQYAGNWASAMWAFAPGRRGEARRAHQEAGPACRSSSSTAIYGEDEAEVIMQQLLAGASMHSQGRGLNSVMIDAPRATDIDTLHAARGRVLLQRRSSGSTSVTGTSTTSSCIEAIQERCQFAPGEFIVVWVESEAGRTRLPGVLGDGRRGRRRRARHAGRCCEARRGAAVAAQRPDPDRGRLAHARLRAASATRAAEPRADRSSDGRAGARSPRDRRRSWSAAGPTGSLPPSPWPPRASSVARARGGRHARRRHAQQRADAARPASTTSARPPTRWRSTRRSRGASTSPRTA